MTEAERILNDFLRQFGLDKQGFANRVLQTVFRGELPENPDINTIATVMMNDPVIKERFPANDVLLKKGKPIYSAQQYLLLEQSYLDVMRNKGLPGGFYDDPVTDLQGFIANGVSPNELRDRIDLGFRAVKEADPQVVQEFQRLYGIGEADLTAYFLDPERAKTEFDSRVAQRQAQSAQIAAQARLQAGLDLTQQEAEALQTTVSGLNVNVTGAAMQGFQQVAQTQEIAAPLLGEQGTLTQAEQIGSAFGTNQAAMQRVATRRRQRRATFEAGGGFATGQQGVAGLGTGQQ